MLPSASTDPLVQLRDFFNTPASNTSMSNTPVPSIRKGQLDQKHVTPDNIYSFPLINIEVAKQFDYLEGPTSLTHFYRFSDGMQIYVMGDVHERFGSCQTKTNVLKITKFFETTSKQNMDKIIDVYAEFPFVNATIDPERIEYEKSKDPYEDSGYLMNDFYNEYKKCLLLKKTNCPLKNMRFHYIDIRDRADQNLMMFLNEIRHLPDIWEQSKLENPKDPLDFLKFAIFDTNHINWGGEKLSLIAYLNIFKTEWKDYTMKTKAIFERSKIQKNIDRIANRDIQFELQYIMVPNLTLIEFYIDALFRHLKILEGLVTMKKSQTLKDHNEKMATSEIHELYRIGLNITELFAKFMDIYTLARIFKTSSTGEKAKYVIIYAGERHCQTYRHFLEKFDFIKISESMSQPRDQCRSLYGFQQPFFSKFDNSSISKKGGGRIKLKIVL